jgi:hypothetical protein
MRRHTLRRYVAYSLLLASLTLTALPAKPQERKVAPPSDVVPVLQGACPKPITLTLTANPPSFVAADFTQGQLNSPHMTGLNSTTSGDQNFIYTFKWKRDERCCQITKAVLTVKMKSLQGGQSATSNDAGNDGITIMHAGAVVLPYNEAVYSSVPRPFPAGTVVTKSWNLQGAALSNLNNYGTNGFAVQDDTAVQSATLQLWGCCLSAIPKGAAEEPSTAASSN